MCSHELALGHAHEMWPRKSGGFNAPRPRAGARIHYSPGGLREATSCILAVGSSTHLDSPWLHWPEACGCVQAPYAHLPIAGGG